MTRLGQQKPLVRNPRACLVLGLLAFALGARLLYDAYEGRGRKTPRVLRPFLFW